jgi:hypothetical protein
MSTKIPHCTDRQVHPRHNKPFLLLFRDRDTPTKKQKKKTYSIPGCRNLSVTFDFSPVTLRVPIALLMRLGSKVDKHPIISSYLASMHSCMRVHPTTEVALSARSPALVGLRPEGKETVWHGLNVPDLGCFLVKSSGPLLSQVCRELPSQLVIAESHAHQVSTFLGSLTVDKTFSAMQDCEVVDEMHVTCTCADLQLSCLGDVLDGVQCVHLAWRNGGKVSRAWVNCISRESYTPKVDQHSPLVMKEDWSALKTGPIPA